MHTPTSLGKNTKDGHVVGPDGGGILSRCRKLDSSRLKKVDIKACTPSGFLGVGLIIKILLMSSTWCISVRNWYTAVHTSTYQTQKISYPISYVKKMLNLSSFLGPAYIVYGRIIHTYILGTYQYIPVRTSTYSYILRYNYLWSDEVTNHERQCIFI